MIRKLTKRTIDTISPVEKPTIFYDSDLTGFCVKVLPSGIKRWCVEYQAAQAAEVSARLGWSSDRPRP